MSIVHIRLKPFLAAGVAAAVAAVAAAGLAASAPMATENAPVLPPTGASWVAAEGTAEPADQLHAGDLQGGAVTYLQFDVPETVLPAGAAARLELTSAEPALPELVELVAVPDTDWDADELHWQSAPLLGQVIESIQPDGDQLSFDVSTVLDGPGTYGFAVTVPPDLGFASFVGADGSPRQPVLRLPSAGGEYGERYYGGPAGSPSECELGELLVPSCGSLWGVAPAGHTGDPRTATLEQFESDTGRMQHIYHAYHRDDSLFPNQEEVAIAADGRLLFLNWKPLSWSWAQIAAGDPAVDDYLDRLAEHILENFPEPFFLTLHHEPENDVRPEPGSGWEATDFAEMFRYVIQRLRDAGVDNLVTVMNYMGYVPWTGQPWWPDLYPGDEVVDWIGWDTYAYSDPGYGHGDFAELMNRRSALNPDWPGFYNWLATEHPDKPLMLAEWGVWHSDQNPGHMAELYDSAARQFPLFPRMKALVYFDTPADQRGRDSRPTATTGGLEAYQRLGNQRFFQVALTPTGDPGAGYGG